MSATRIMSLVLLVFSITGCSSNSYSNYPTSSDMPIISNEYPTNNGSASEIKLSPDDSVKGMVLKSQKAILQEINERVSWINENAEQSAKEEFSDDNADYGYTQYINNILVCRYFSYYFDHERFAVYVLYYSESGQLIYADISHYRGTMYSIYFQNDELFYVDVESSIGKETSIRGGMEEINNAIETSDEYSFVLEDIRVCLAYAYKEQ